MQTISIRLDDKVITKIEELRGTENKSDFYRKLIEHALMTFEHKEITSDDKEMTGDYTLLQAKIKSMEDLLKAKDGNIKDLQNQVGFLQLDHGRISGQLDRLLMPSQEEVKKKAWWKFWKLKI